VDEGIVDGKMGGSGKMSDVEKDRSDEKDQRDGKDEPNAEPEDTSSFPESLRSRSNTSVYGGVV
jgi:hypothetical protein